MKFEFDSNNATELRAVEAAVAVLLDRLPAKTVGELKVKIDASEAVAAVTEALEAIGPVTSCTAERSVVVQTETGVHQLQTGVHDLGGATVAVALPGEEAAMREAVEAAGLPPIPPTEELDSAGQPWNPELHSSSRAKVADGTWKKKRSVKTEAPAVLTADGQPTPEVVAKVLENATSSPPVPPAPATPPAPPVPVPAAGQPSAEQKIWALYTGQVVTINRVLEVARAHGYADLGALRQADEAKKLEVLKVLEGE